MHPVMWKLQMAKHPIKFIPPLKYTSVRIIPKGFFFLAKSLLLTFSRSPQGFTCLHFAINSGIPALKALWRGQEREERRGGARTELRNPAFISCSFNVVLRESNAVKPMISFPLHVCVYTHLIEPSKQNQFSLWTEFSNLNRLLFVNKRTAAEVNICVLVYLAVRSVERLNHSQGLRRFDEGT